MIDQRKAAAIIDDAHDALNRGDIESFLDFVTDDFVYESNASPGDEGPMALVGKAEFTRFWAPVYKIVSTRTVPEKLSLQGDVVRVRMTAVVTHHDSGSQFTAGYQQLITFRNARFSYIKEIHDAAKLNSFCRFLLSIKNA